MYKLFLFIALLTLNLNAQSPDIFVQDYAFSRTMSGTLTAATPTVVQFNPSIGGCPGGVNGADLEHYIRITGGTGTAENILITQTGGAGTCTSGASSGTIKFTPANNHSGAWKLVTATSGFQEAFNVGCSLNAGRKQIIVALAAPLSKGYAPTTDPCMINVTGQQMLVPYVIDCSFSTGQDVLIIKPGASGVAPTTGITMGTVIKSLSIIPDTPSASPCSSPPARYGINISSTVQAIQYLSIDSIIIGLYGYNGIHAGLGFSSYGINIVASAPPTNGVEFSRSSIKNSVIANGIQLTEVGDSVSIEDNTMWSSSGRTAGINGVSQLPGASMFRIIGNNISNLGGTICLGNDFFSPIITLNTLEDRPRETDPWGAFVAPSTGCVASTPGAGLTLNTTTAAGIITAGVVNAAGLDYFVGQSVSVNGGVGALFRVATVGGTGNVTSVTLSTGGSSGYTNTTGATTNSAGAMLGLIGRTSGVAPKMISPYVGTNSFQLSAGSGMIPLMIYNTQGADIVDNRFNKGNATWSVVNNCTSEYAFFNVNRYTTGGSFSSEVNDCRIETVGWEPRAQLPGYFGLFNSSLVVENALSFSSIGFAGTVYSMLTTNGDDSVSLQGYHARNGIVLTDGASYFYGSDGDNHILSITDGDVNIYNPDSAETAHLNFQAQNGSTVATYAQIGVDVVDGTVGNETGGFIWSTVAAGVLSEVMTLDSAGTLATINVSISSAFTLGSGATVVVPGGTGQTECVSFGAPDGAGGYDDAHITFKFGVLTSTTIIGACP